MPCDTQPVKTSSVLAPRLGLYIAFVWGLCREPASSYSIHCVLVGSPVCMEPCVLSCVCSVLNSVHPLVMECAHVLVLPAQTSL